MATIRIGVSGWRYTPWRGVFYPVDLPQRLELAYASRVLSTIEINGSFYCLQRPEYFAQWRDETPADFVFAVKGGRFITHMKRLRDIEAPLANFFASGIFNLRHKLGPILWQFPPNMQFDTDRFAAFFKLLPHDTGAALRLARRRDHRLKGRARLAIDAERPMRHAIEIRHVSFRCPEFIDLLCRHGIALVIAETARRWPMLQDITADFVYLRLHGDKEIYVSGYSDRALDRWAARIAAWHRGAEPDDAQQVIVAKAPESGPRDVFCYFDNTDVKLRAPADAQTLMRKLGIIRDKRGQHVVGEAAGAASRQSPYLLRPGLTLPRGQAEKIVSGFLDREAKRSAQR
ncbi:MAG TPA: DUF72 domain-containing protein [Steroidobacteraceae bacterium]|nr:DUF72 domain-containing protein [Steroidobacteraceae bacterium]